MHRQRGYRNVTRFVRRNAILHHQRMSTGAGRFEAVDHGMSVQVGHVQTLGDDYPRIYHEVRHLSIKMDAYLETST